MGILENHTLQTGKLADLGSPLNCSGLDVKTFSCLPTSLQDPSFTPSIENIAGGSWRIFLWDPFFVPQEPRTWLIMIFSRGSLLTFIFHYWVGEHQLEIDHVTDATVHEKSPQFNASQKELYKQLFRVDRKKILLSKHVSVSLQSAACLFQWSWSTWLFRFKCSEQPLRVANSADQTGKIWLVSRCQCFLINCSLPRYIHSVCDYTTYTCLYIYMTIQYIYISRSNIAFVQRPFQSNNQNRSVARSPKVVPRSLGKKWLSCRGSAPGCRRNMLGYQKSKKRHFIWRFSNC